MDAASHVAAVIMRTTMGILASALFACGFPDSNTNVVPIDASSDESGSDALMCGELECADDEVCVEDESPQTDQPASQRCVSVAACPVVPPDCQCIDPVCGEGLECVPLGLATGRLFRCELPEPDTTSGGSGS